MNVDLHVIGLDPSSTTITVIARCGVLLLIIAASGCGDNKTYCSGRSYVVPTHVECQHDRVDMFVVAHPDDDLLFMSPAILEAVGEGHQLVGVYVTAGDLGEANNDEYWIAREHGIVNAYSYMLTGSSIQPRTLTELNEGWSVQNVAIPVAANRQITVARYSRTQEPLVSLYFLRLGDYQSQCLWEQATGCSSLNPSSHSLPYLAVTKSFPGNAPLMVPADQQMQSQDVGRSDLLAMLLYVMRTSSVSRVLAQDASGIYFDAFGGPSRDGHTEYWDHFFVALFTVTSALRYQADEQRAIEIEQFRGYSINAEPPNVKVDAACAKFQVFSRYAIFDADIVDASDSAAAIECPECFIAGGYGVDSSESWQFRQYGVASMMVSGRLQNADQCLAVVDGAPTLVGCDAAPAWAASVTGQVTDDEGHCLRVSSPSGYVTRPAPECSEADCQPPPTFPADRVDVVDCAAVQDEGTSLVAFGNGQIATPNGRCLTATDAGILSADCAAAQAADGRTTRQPARSQQWDWQPLP